MIMPASQVLELLLQIKDLLTQLADMGVIQYKDKDALMATKVSKKIVGYKVITETENTTVVQPEKATIPLHEVKRPTALQGVTYQIKEPTHPVMLVTMTDIKHEGEQRPYELLINSSHVDHSQWTIALSKLVTALFKRGGAVRFIAEELEEIHDPHGGWFEKGKRVPSTVAAIGGAMVEHFNHIGVKS